MRYNPVTIDYENKTILGVDFSLSSDFDAVANALGTVMYEGYEPTPKGIAIIRDYINGTITLHQLIQLTKEKAYA